MSETLSVRLPEGEKQRLRRAAERVGESLGEYVRKAALRREEGETADEWEGHFGMVETELTAAPRNADIRRAMRGK